MGEREVPCAKLAVRTDRIDEAGKRVDEEPWNNLFVWIQKDAPRSILKISGDTPFARVNVTLRERRIGDGKEVAADPGGGVLEESATSAARDDREYGGQN